MLLLIESSDKDALGCGFDIYHPRRRLENGAVLEDSTPSALLCPSVGNDCRRIRELCDNGVHSILPARYAP